MSFVVVRTTTTRWNSRLRFGVRLGSQLETLSSQLNPSIHSRHSRALSDFVGGRVSHTNHHAENICEKGDTIRQGRVARVCMQHAAVVLVLAAWPAALLADSPERPTRDATRVSAHISEMIRADLPKYTPQVEQPAAARSESSPSLTSDPDVLEMRKVTVTDQRPVRIDALDILTKAARKRKLARDFKDSFTGLNRLLNGFSIPMLSRSMAERGRVYHEQQEWEELTSILSVAEEVHPKGTAARRKDGADTKHAVEGESRPAGGK